VQPGQVPDYRLDGISRRYACRFRVDLPLTYATWRGLARARPFTFRGDASPPEFEGYFRELAPLLGHADSEEESIEARRQLSGKYDIEIVGRPVDVLTGGIG
jgi:hypothetical protein